MTFDEMLLDDIELFFDAEEGATIGVIDGAESVVRLQEESENLLEDADYKTLYFPSVDYNYKTIKKGSSKIVIDSEAFRILDLDKITKYVCKLVIYKRPVA